MKKILLKNSSKILLKKIKEILLSFSLLSSYFHRLHNNCVGWWFQWPFCVNGCHSSFTQIRHRMPKTIMLLQLFVSSSQTFDDALDGLHQCWMVSLSFSFAIFKMIDFLFFLSPLSLNYSRDDRTPHAVTATATASTGNERQRLKRRRPLVDEVIEVQWRRNNTSLNDEDDGTSSVSVSLNTPTIPSQSKLVSSPSTPTPSSSASSPPSLFPVVTFSTALIEGMVLAILLAAAAAVFMSTTSYFLLSYFFPRSSS